MPGKPKTPTAILKLRGSASKVSARRNEPAPKKCSGLPRKPEHLKGEAAKYYKAVGKKLLNMGVLTVVDYEALVVMCEEYGQYKEADKLCKTLLIKTSNGNVIQNPAIGIRNKAREALKKSMSYFGMTPSSRASLSIKVEVEQEDKTKRFFKNRTA
jgi:P27 family predicted phage terminase small subunit